MADEEGASLERTPRVGYQTIAQTLRERIERGDYAAKSKVPSEPQLVNEFGVARATVRRAISNLAEAGLIITVPGVGSFVAGKATTPPPRPRHEQISSWLREQIESGRLSPGEEIPSEAELAVQFDAARTTVRRALKTLEDMELVQIEPGKRRTVSKPQ